MPEECQIDSLVEFASFHDNKPNVLAMLAAYLDETGIHEGAEVCAICGYWGDKIHWRRFEKRWRAMLREFKIPMAEFKGSRLYKRSYPFADFTDDEYNQLLEAILTIVRDHKIYPVTFGIVVKDFMDLPLNHRKFLTNAKIENGRFVSSGNPKRPYFLPFHHCLGKVSRNVPKGAKAHYFFGLDKTFGAYAHTLFRYVKSEPLLSYHDKLGEIGFPRASETPQLQIADVLAYWSYVHLQERIRIGLHNPTDFHMGLLHKAKREEDFIYFDRESMMELIKGITLPE